jgi:hypothetical protein
MDTIWFGFLFGVGAILAVLAAILFARYWRELLGMFLAVGAVIVVGLVISVSFIWFNNNAPQVIGWVLGLAAVFAVSAGWNWLTTKWEEATLRGLAQERQEWHQAAAERGYTKHLETDPPPGNAPSAVNASAFAWLTDDALRQAKSAAIDEGEAY